MKHEEIKEGETFYVEGCEAPHVCLGYNTVGDVIGDNWISYPKEKCSLLPSTPEVNSKDKKYVVSDKFIHDAKDHFEESEFPVTMQRHEAEDIYSMAAQRGYDFANKSTPEVKTELEQMEDECVENCRKAIQNAPSKRFKVTPEVKETQEEEVILSFAKKLIDSQQPIPPDIQKVINKRFREMI